MKKSLIAIIICAGLIIAALLVYVLIDSKPPIDIEELRNMSPEELETLTLSDDELLYLLTYVDETYHPFKNFDEFRDDYMVMVEIIKRNKSALEASGSNVIIWYGSSSDTRIEMMTGETWEISEEEKKSVRKLNGLYRGWVSIHVYDDYLQFISTDGTYELAYSFNGKPPPTVNEKNGSKYYKPIDLGGDWYALSMKIE